MTLYADSSALLKRYIDEPDAALTEEILATDPDLVTGRHTVVEVRRNLARLLDGRALASARREFDRDIGSFALVELDADTCEVAAVFAEQTGVKALDALHLGAVQRVGGAAVTMLTFDAQQARVARNLGFTVVGA